VRTITIEITDQGFTVREGYRYHDGLCWDEMLGQVTELTHPKLGQTRYPMLTALEWATRRAQQEQNAARRREEAEAREMTYQKQHPTNHQ
jgi:hypothetical protein